MGAPPSRVVLMILGVTLVRIPLALLFALLVWLDPSSTATLAAGTVLLALIEASDVLDGQLARRLNAVTQWGAMLDPYADSVSRITLYWALALVGLTYWTVPLAMAVRDVTVAYCRIIWTRAGRSVSAQWSGKMKAVVQGAAAFFLLYVPRLFSPWVRDVFSWLVLAVTLLSLADYCWKTVRILAAADGDARHSR
jgi:CDP-diacylglycerol--glycerol-3-phosphate 3-phosphatidyltransferase